MRKRREGCQPQLTSLSSSASYSQPRPRPQPQSPGAGRWPFGNATLSTTPAPLEHHRTQTSGPNEDSYKREEVERDRRGSREERRGEERREDTYHSRGRRTLHAATVRARRSRPNCDVGRGHIVTQKTRDISLQPWPWLLGAVCCSPLSLASLSLASLSLASLPLQLSFSLSNSLSVTLPLSVRCSSAQVAPTSGLLCVREVGAAACLGLERARVEKLPPQPRADKELS